MTSSVRLHTYFAGGRTGAWDVERMSAVMGPPLPAVDRVAVREDQHLSDPQGSAWLLHGVTSHERYVQRRERSALVERQPALGRPEATRAALEGELGLPVLTGMKHWTPRIAEAAQAALGTGADRIAGLVLAPHYSRLSIGGYRQQLEEALAGRAELAFVESWHAEPGFLDALASVTREALDQLAGSLRDIEARGRPLDSTPGQAETRLRRLNLLAAARAAREVRRRRRWPEPQRQRPRARRFRRSRGPGRRQGPL